MKNAMISLPNELPKSSQSVEWMPLRLSLCYCYIHYLWKELPDHQISRITAKINDMSPINWQKWRTNLVHLENIIWLFSVQYFTLRLGKMVKLVSYSWKTILLTYRRTIRPRMEKRRHYVLPMWKHFILYLNRNSWIAEGEVALIRIGEAFII